MDRATDDIPTRPDRPRLRGRLTLIALMLVFALPLAAAGWLYQHPEIWSPTTFTNHGQLVDPPQPLESPTLVTVSGEPFDAERFRRYWTLLYVGGARCDPGCEEALVTTRQVRLALGHNIDRVQRVYLLTESPTVADLIPMLGQHPRLHLVTGDREALAPLMQRLGSDAVGHIYLIDPLGNLVLRYAPGANGSGMLKDLRKLLRNSRIG